MKTNRLIFGLGVFLAVTGLWLGRMAWRIHHQLVTLHVRNTPLAEVLRQVERQTRQKIPAEQNLDARITLNLVDKPFAHVLDRIAEQAAAEWSTKYAVYQSGQALKSLETALRGDGNMEKAGWTRIAPKAPILPLPEEEGDLPPPAPGLQIKRLGSNPGQGVRVIATEDVIAGPSDRPPMTLRIVRRSGPGGASTIDEVWTPEELILESALRSRLGDHPVEMATPNAAAETARTVNGRWTTFFAFRKAPFGMGASFSNLQPPAPGMEHFLINRGGNGTNETATPSEGQQPLPGPGAPDFQALANRENNARFARLTPEQRVQAARRRLEQIQTQGH
jgi:hypothetical protein